MKLILVALCLSIALCPALQAERRRGGKVGEKITFTTEDGIVISGLYAAPSGSSKVFILLHGLGSGQEEWQPFVHYLVRAGYGFLSYDARGHGESVLTKDNRKITYESFGAPGPGSPWSFMVADLGRAVQFLNTAKGIPTRRIGLIGASLGANVALQYAANVKEVPAVVLLSPGLVYAGLTTREAARSFTNRPILLVASPDDTYAYQSSMILLRELQKDPRAQFMQGAAGHGVQMFTGELESRVIKWLQR
jgi:pimeloyl-ACP methyl ester carboxylesterase